MKKQGAIDHDLPVKLQARWLSAKVKATLPGDWHKHVDALATYDKKLPAWMQAGAWLEKIQAFKEQHGGALNWAMSDSEICDKARALSLWVEELLALTVEHVPGSPELSMGGAEASIVVRLDKVLTVCDLVGVEYPVSVTAEGAVQRALSPVWWRRVLRRTVARIVEAGAIKLGGVNFRDGGYCSEGAVKRRQDQIKRNAEMMAGTLLRNEAGQVFTLAELAKKSTANPEIRGGELMTRIRGCEEFADAAGHVGYFFTNTAPSKFHAVRMVGEGSKARPQKNPNYDGVSNPRDAQLWLRQAWARSRAAIARLDVKMYGFRVAEPHHDGCPHWHMLVWFESVADAEAAIIAIGKQWLSDGGEVLPVSRAGQIEFTAGPESKHERGALKQRFQVKRLESGTAAGYIAKYIAKSIGHFDVGVHLDSVDGEKFELDTRDVKGWQRVDAWAAVWGIRQFQAIGQPSVTAWREMRRVTKDQVETARVQGDGVAWKLWGAVQRSGNVMACWCRYMTNMGGVALARDEYAMRTASRVDAAHVNGYGETVEKKVTVGLELRSGRWLISRRQSWSRVINEEVTVVAGVVVDEFRAALAAPWSGFNNCTARLTGNLRAALIGLKTGPRIAAGERGWGGYGGNFANA